MNGFEEASWGDLSRRQVLRRSGLLALGVVAVALGSVSPALAKRRGGAPGEGGVSGNRAGGDPGEGGSSGKREGGDAGEGGRSHGRRGGDAGEGGSA